MGAGISSERSLRGLRKAAGSCQEEVTTAGLASKPWLVRRWKGLVTKLLESDRGLVRNLNRFLHVPIGVAAEQARRLLARRQRVQERRSSEQRAEGTTFEV